MLKPVHEQINALLQVLCSTLVEGIGKHVILADIPFGVDGRLQEINCEPNYQSHL
jgi:hypothetical protein